MNYFCDGSDDKPWPFPTVQHIMSTNLLVLYSVFGLAVTVGEGDPLCHGAVVAGG